MKQGDSIPPTVEPGGDDVRNRWMFRWLLVACYAATVILTWQLWRVREYPPNLPVIDVGPGIGMGYLMLIGLAAVLVRPVAGLIAHTLVLAAAMELDQMRLQPEFVSMTILMWGTLAKRGPLLVARAHLVALWFFA